MRELTPQDREALDSLIASIVTHLPNRNFLIPLSEAEREELFSPDSQDMAYGIFEEEKLVAATGLFFDLRDFYEEEEFKEVEWKYAAELGGNMTLPSCRGKGYMRKLCQQILKCAQEKGIKYLFATAHPENLAGMKCLLTIGMKCVKEYDRHGYRRNIYFLELDSEKELL